MNDLQNIINFFTVHPMGKMLRNGVKDFVINHAIPYYRGKFNQPTHMSDEEVEKRAREEFQTVDDFDLPHEEKDK
jgi:hypothetical protein